MIYQNDALLIMGEMISCRLFFETFAVRKAGRPHWMPLAALACLGGVLYGLSHWLAGHLVFKMYLAVLATGLFMLTYLDLSVIRAFVLAFVFRCLIVVVDYAGIAFVLYFMADYQPLIKLYLAVANIFCKLCSFFLIFAFNRIFQKHSGDIMQMEDRLRFSLFPVFSIVMLAAVIAAYQYVEWPQQADILVIIAVGQLGMNIFVYYLLENLLKREQKIRQEKLSIMETGSQIKMYQAVSENYNRQRKQVHEFKNQILCIEGLLSQKKYDKAQEYVRGISGRLELETNIIQTNHPIINAILNMKYKEAQEKGIVFAAKVNDLSGIWLEDADIVVILSNLLDNAMEAAEQCEKKRVIWLKFVIEGGAVLSVKNTYAQKPVVEGGKFITGKPEKDFHGIGLQNVANTVKKYDASYTVKYEGGEFLVSVFIPCQSG